MDVNLINTLNPSSYESQNTELTNLSLPDKNVQIKIQEKVMMDLKDVQNFLYMLIGSNLSVNSNNSSVGSNINTIA